MMGETRIRDKSALARLQCAGVSARVGALQPRNERTLCDRVNSKTAPRAQVTLIRSSKVGAL